MALCIVVLLFSYLSIGNCGELFLKDKDSIQILLLPEAKERINFTHEDKAILRYGFHRTHDCQNFEKAFVCIRKCLDLDYQIAHSDKKCKCTCYKNAILSQYKPKFTGVTKWKLGAPTTSLPPWLGKGESKPNDYEINANITEFVDSKEDGAPEDHPVIVSAPDSKEQEDTKEQEPQGEIVHESQSETTQESQGSTVGEFTTTDSTSTLATSDSDVPTTETYLETTTMEDEAVVA